MRTVISARDDEAPSENLMAMPGTSLKLKCKADAHPPAVYAWTKPANMLPASATVNGTSGVLVIPNVRKNDAGLYKCMARNGIEPYGIANINVTIRSADELGPIALSTGRPSEYVVPLSASLLPVGGVLIAFTVLKMFEKAIARRRTNAETQMFGRLREEDPEQLLPLQPLSEGAPQYPRRMTSGSRDSSTGRNASGSSKPVSSPGKEVGGHILREFWNSLVKIDVDAVTAYLQDDQVLSADHVAEIRAAPSVVDKLLDTISELEGEKSAQVLSKALRRTDQNHLADLLEGKNAKCLTAGTRMFGRMKNPLKHLQLRPPSEGLPQHFRRVTSGSRDSHHMPKGSENSTSGRLLAALSPETETVDLTLREFWGDVVKMDVDPVLSYLQEHKVLSADQVAEIRAAPSVVDKLLDTISELEGEKSAQVLSKALRHTDQNHLADLLEGKSLPDAKRLTSETRMFRSELELELVSLPSPGRPPQYFRRVTSWAGDSGYEPKVSDSSKFGKST
ncbi:uncharacterized protein [Branchiostoma lanceolatum]|uniref:uncharacterized protein n=1 Tax=Branchiostoma lanceolatum TaxID=7740 RepID=UPI003456FB90